MANPFNAFNDNRPLVIGGAYNAAKAIAGSQGVLAKGSVLGVITASGLLRLTAIGNGDGSEVPRFVVTKEEGVDTGVGVSVTEDVLKAGVVNGELLVFGNAETLDSVVVALGMTNDDLLKANGIIAVRGTDLEAYDNT